MLKEKVKAFVNKHKDEIISTLIELVKIPSVSTDRENCEKMLLAVKELYQKYGFETKEGDEFLLSYYGNGEEEIGLFAHGDVVEGGDGWLITNPFEPKIYNGAIVGRGAWDDKSAIVCSLYALIALKELEIPLDKKMLCFTGFNEENGMTDIKNYLKSYTPPHFSIVLDAGFPVYIGDKGKSWVKVRSQRKLNQITKLGGGKMINITLGNAEARVKYTSELYNSLVETDRVKISKQDDEIIISSSGISAHGANPEGAINGAYLIAEALKNANGLDQSDKEIIKNLSELLKSPYGEVVGLENNDPVFGKLTMTNGITNIEDGKLAFTFDLRYGKEVKAKEMLEKLEKELSARGFDLEIINSDDAYALDKDNKYLKEYIDAYKDYTGETEIPVKISAGSTYAKVIGNACEIGTRYNGTWLDLPNGHGFAHQPDENTSVEGLLNALEIIIYSVIKLVGKKY